MAAPSRWMNASAGRFGPAFGPRQAQVVIAGSLVARSAVVAVLADAARESPADALSAAYRAPQSTGGHRSEWIRCPPAWNGPRRAAGMTRPGGLGRTRDEEQGRQTVRGRASVRERRGRREKGLVR